jgi:hypothetical protein
MFPDLQTAANRSNPRFGFCAIPGDAERAIWPPQATCDSRHALSVVRFNSARPGGSRAPWQRP